MATSAPRKKAARSGNPAKRAAAVPSTKADWKGRVQPEGEPLLLPSGNTALVRRPGPEALLSQGFLPDTLGAIVQEAINSKKGLKKQAVADIASDPQKLAEAMDAIDRVCATVVIKPGLVWHKAFKEDADGEGAGSTAAEVIPFEDRDPEVFYTDEVDMEDRMHIFQFALGGTRKWERFRQESGFAVGSLDAFEDAEDPAE